jgi:transposase
LSSITRLDRRALAVLEPDRGRSAADLADMPGGTRPSASHGATAYARDLDPSALAEEDRSGRPRLRTEGIEDLLRSLLASAPQHFGHQATTWTAPLLRHEVERSRGLWPSDDPIRRGPRRLGFVWERPRSVLDPDPEREGNNGGAGGRSRPCRAAASCRVRTRPTSCCSRP